MEVAKSLNAFFDGKVFWPEKPLDLTPDIRVRLIVDIIEPSKKKSDSFLQTARNLDLDGPGDWASNLEEYLYGKKANE